MRLRGPMMQELHFPYFTKARKVGCGADSGVDMGGAGVRGAGCCGVRRGGGFPDQTHH